MNRTPVGPLPWIGLTLCLALLLQETMLRMFAEGPSLAQTSYRIAVMAIGVGSLALILLPARRLAWFLGFVFCGALMGFALYLQYVVELDPCPLCILQRVATIGCGVLFLVAALHNPGRVGTWVYTALLVIVAGAGLAIASRHVWIQSLPKDKVPECGMGLEYMLETLPLADVVTKVFTGSGECAAVDWVFLNLSIPAWTLVMFVAIIVAALAIARRD
jgi:disulfide bond formation protein DsbB